MNFFISNPVNNILMYKITNWKLMIILYPVNSAQVLSQHHWGKYSKVFHISLILNISNKDLGYC